VAALLHGRRADGQLDDRGIDGLLVRARGTRGGHASPRWWGREEGLCRRLRRPNIPTRPRRRDRRIPLHGGLRDLAHVVTGRRAGWGHGYECAPLPRPPASSFCRAAV
jgi:hypothetical protein